jgi:hypothetical protein
LTPGLFAFVHGERPRGRLMGLAEASTIDQTSGDLRMARKPATRAEFALFDVFYEDGSQRSNRRVPSDILGGFDGDEPARAVIEEQDRLIAEKSGKPPLALKSLRRSGGK